ncbi:carboxypeptidase regulatory-like domain-containing protein [Jiangella sp. DSM 45060]|uniref:carboxypeptidase regulatory-like domain-containing protein n=1 Tax=Jiangella sp. DSM 45060 TaxID=1798224 RepID=UPI00087A100E|nr:carboxypeptidase regulatory-like domain-containing protein [Jiangella sp. DSM 45060]SDS70985.1 Carboxypeptidase regulatory-like domain-containing protein [Jiangella sp. DSM 45060]
MTEAAPVVEVTHEPQGAAGRSAALTVRVHHGADGPRDVTLTVLGLDGGWAPVPARIVALAPRTAATVELELTPPPGTVAAAYPFVVAAQSSDPATGAVTSRAAVAEAVLTVDRPPAVTVAAEPGEVRTAWRRGVRLVLTNSGPRPATVELELHAPDGLSARSRRRAVEVPARSAVSVGGRVGPRRLRLTGDTTRFEYTALARGPHAPATAHGVVVARPLIGSAAKRAVALAAVLAVWVAAAVVGLPRLVDRIEERQAEAGAAADAGSGNDGGSGGSGADDGAGAGSGADGGGAGDGPADADEPEPLRVSGVVQADQPDGVTVSIAPTSAFGEAGDDAKVPPPAAPAGGDGDPVDQTRSTVTNEDGAWAFAGLGTGGHYLVTVSKAGFQTERRVVDAAAAAEPIDVELRAGDGRMSGTVTGPDGPVGGAQLTLTDGTVTVSTSTSTTGDVGSWAVDGLSTPSTYLVTATAEGLGAGAALVELDAGAEESQDLALRRGVATLTGQVTGRDGTGATRGLGGVTVTADDGETTRTATTATTGGEAGGPGLFTLPDLPIPGRYTVTVAGEGYQPQTREVTLTDPDQAVRRLDTRLVPAGGEVAGVVTDDAGTPLAAGLTLSSEEGAAYKVMSAPGTGGYRISGVAPGSYVLSAEVFGHVTGYARVEVTAGSVAAADLALTPIPGDGLTATSVIVGRAVDASTGGGPIGCPALLPGEECAVTVTTTATGIDGEPRELSATFAPDASYTLPAAGEPGLLPGLYELEFTAPGYEPERLRVEVPMDATVNAPVAALLPAPSIVGTITARVGNVPDGTCVVAVPAGADPEALGDCVPVTPDPDAPLCRIDGGAHCAFTGLNGSYELTGLPSGYYDVSVRPGDPEYRPVAPVKIGLYPGDVRRYDAALDRLGRLRVTAQANDGEGATQPAAGAAVRVLAGDEDVTDQIRIDRTDEASGVYAVTHLQPGVQYRLVFGWPVPGSDPPRVLTGEVLSTVGLNNEIPLALTLTGASRSFTGQVLHELDDAGPVGVDGVQVQVTGIVGYDGLLPEYRSTTVVTDADGLFAVVPEPGQGGGLPEAVLPIVDSRVDVTATKDGYERSRLTGVAVSDSQQLRLTLTPLGRPVQGRVRLVPATAADLSQAELTVTAAPPGAEATRIAVTPGGCLVWSDPAQRVDTGYTNECGEGPGETRATLARPGRYVVEARLAGYADVTVRLDVALATTGGRQQLEGFVLSRHGALELATVDAAGEPVYGARLVLSAPGVPEQTRAAEPGTNRTVFTELPSLLSPGGQYAVRVEAAGYRFDTFTTGQLVTGGVPAPDPTPFLVPPDGVGSYQLSLVKLGEISGVLESHTVVDGEVVAAPLVGGTVVARHESGLEFSAVSGPGGRFTLTGSRDVAGLLPGTWEVRADPPDGYAFDGDPLPVLITADHQAVYPDGNADPFVVAVGAEPVDVFVNVYVPGTGGEPPQPLPGMTVELLRGGVAQSAVPCDGGAGCYRFTGVPPVPQTLRVSGENYAPLTLTVRPEPGAASTFNVPVTQLTNTIQGTVSGQSGSTAAAPLEEVDTWLCPVADVVGDRCPAADGDPVRPGSVFEFAGLADGTYLVDVRPRAGQPYSSTTRTVTVAAGQIVAFDIVLYAEAEPITVTAESVNGWDLTGALVRLVSAGGDPAPAPQPLVRAGGDEYTTTFAQVPAGEWSASVTGPAGHVGVHESGEPDDGSRDLTIEVTEVRVRMDARSDEPDAPGSVAVAITGADDAVVFTEDLLVDAGTVTAYLPAGAYTVAAELPDGLGGWSVAPGSVEVPADAADVAARFRLAGPPATELELAVTPSSPVAGVEATLTATVTSDDEPVDAGTVTFLVDGDEVDSVDVDDGAAELEHAFDDPGGHTVEAVFSSGEHRGSDDLLTVTVIEPVVTLTGPPGDVEAGDPVELVATVDPVVSGRTLRLFDDDGPVGAAVSPGADGEHEFTVDDLEPGEYTFTVRYGTGDLAVESEPVTVTVAEDEVVDP